jgi:hypothetical protein
MKKIHDSLTPERVLAAAEASLHDLSNPGFCLACGADADGCEPDARNYTCTECGEDEVFGAEEIVMMVTI